MAAPPPFVWSDGVRVRGLSIWCDARKAHGLVFLSHAHVPIAPSLRARARLIATERTLALYRAVSTPPGEVLVTPFARPFSLGRARLELLPSGHLPGGAQLL